MKICGISDIHGNLIENIPECDVLCICGDIINLNDQRDMSASAKWWSTKFIKWVDKLLCKKVLIVPGNHDFFLEKAGSIEFIEKLSDKIKVLIDDSYEYEGIMFYGTPWIKPIQFQENRWAFSSQDHFENIPYCDVLLTHDSPHHNNVLDYYSYNRSKYHLYGHWHSGKNDISLGRYNCSRLDDWYNFKNDYEFVILDIMTEAEKNKVEQDFLKSIILEMTSDEFCLEGTNSYEILNWLEDMLDEELPELQQDTEDEVEWETCEKSDGWLESSMISDVED